MSEEKKELDEYDQIITSDLSKVAIDTRIWGDPTWKFLHLYSLRYPISASKDQQDKEGGFINNVAIRIGCSNCVAHSAKYIMEHPIQLEGRRVLVWWLFDFHNFVNTHTNKQLMTRQEFVQTYIKDNWQKLHKLNNESIEDIVKQDKASTILSFPQSSEKNMENIKILLYAVIIFLCFWISMLYLKKY